MKYSGIGGQAVMEGIMMRNQNRYAVAVRKEDGSIEVTEQEVKSFKDSHPFAKWPMVRGVVSFVESLVIGMKTLMWSASMIEDETPDEPKKTAIENKQDSEKEDKAGTEEKKNGGSQGNQVLSTGAIAMTVVLGAALAIGLFSILPALITSFLKQWIPNELILAVIEGVVRLGIFIAYVGLVGLMPEIKRTYMYHGSEHKCINCIEHGLPLTVENVMKSSKEHKRCGTSFLLLVMLISIIVFMIIRVESLPLKILVRILMIPVIAGVSYEILQFTGRHDNLFTHIISRPGMWMQALTTKEPTPDMVEVAIQAVEKVFDWKTFIEGMQQEK